MLILLFVALIVDRIIGDPDWLWRSAPHPVVVFGRAIGWADARFNDPALPVDAREKLGLAVIVALLVAALVGGALITRLLGFLGPFGWLIEIGVVAVFLAQKSLADHVLAVAEGFDKDGLAGGRRAVSMIVGRNPETLDEAGVSRAAIESLAENASDGVVAPAFWYALLGLQGLLAYKMLNTADSMIGHKTDRHHAFGRASAKLDDAANWVPARLTGALIVGASLVLHGRKRAADAWQIMLRDAQLHRSPNAGWPESAMAGALDIALGGPRIYDGDVADEPFMNDDGNHNVTAADIGPAIEVFWMAMTLGTALIGVLVLLG